MKTLTKPGKLNIPVLLVLAVLIPSFISSKTFTDPFIIPKNFWLYFLSAGVLMVFALWNLSRKFITTYTITRLDIAVTTFFLYTLLRALFTPNLALADDNLLAFILGYTLYILYKPWYRSGMENAKTHLFLIAGIVAIGFVQAGYGILQFLEIVPRLQTEFKLGGAFGNPGPYSNFLVVTIPFSLVLLLYSPKDSRKFYLAIVALAASLVVLPLTKARSAWIATLAGAGYIAYYQFEGKVYLRRVFRGLFIKILAVGLALVLIIVSALFLYKFKEQSSSGRLFIWKVSAQMVPEKPVFGFGFDRYAIFHNNQQAAYFSGGNYTEKEAALADNVTYAFNEYLQTTIETGLFGLALFLLMIFFAFYNKNTMTGTTGITGALPLAGKSALLIVLITGLFSYPLRNVPTNVFFFLLLSVVSANQQGVRELKLNSSVRKTLSLAGMVILLLFAVNQGKKYHASKEWLNGFKLVRSNNYPQAKEKYATLYPVLHYSSYFLFNYGAELSVMGEYARSIEILREAEPGLNDADLYIYLGNSYTGLNDLTNAEQCFRKASNLMPVKFYPKYRLVKIYYQQGEIDKARAMAREILDMKVKIPSDIVEGIRKEMEELIDSN
jgi:O-antigen polymerase